jgi:TRAP-type C4-dicarboxylate transport system substrate-binding protein
MTRLWALLLLAAIACSPQRQTEGVYTLRYATPYPPQHPFSRADQRWIDHVQAASQGKLHIDTFWSGMLTSSDQSVLELRHGVADVAAIQPIYERGGAHVLRTQTGFYAGARRFDEQVSVYKCLAERFPAFDHELSGLTVLAAQGGNLPGIATRDTRIRSLSDLAGLRLRAPSELMGLLEALGADPVTMPMGDVYASLARGVIDGVVAPLDALRSLHLAEVAHNFTRMAIPRGAYPARAVRNESLQRLPSPLQAVVRESRATWEAALAHELSQAEVAGLTYAAEHQIALSDLPAPDQAAFHHAYNKAARERARSLHDGEAMFDAAQNWVATLHAQQSDKYGSTSLNCN